MCRRSRLNVPSASPVELGSGRRSSACATARKRLEFRRARWPSRVTSTRTLSRTSADFLAIRPLREQADEAKPSARGIPGQPHHDRPRAHHRLHGRGGAHLWDAIDDPRHRAHLPRAHHRARRCGRGFGRHGGRGQASRAHADGHDGRDHGAGHGGRRPQGLLRSLRQGRTRRRSAPAPIPASSSTRPRPSSASKPRPPASPHCRGDDMAGTVRDDETFMFDRAAETMARAELAALQLRRLQRTIARAYGKVPPFRRKLDAAGVRPDASQDPRRHRAFSVHGQSRPARQLSVRPVRGRARGTAAAARLFGNHRQADRRRLHAGRSRRCGRT